MSLEINYPFVILDIAAFTHLRDSIRAALAESHSCRRRVRRAFDAAAAIFFIVAEMVSP